MNKFLLGFLLSISTLNVPASAMEDLQEKPQRSCVSPAIHTLTLDLWTSLREFLENRDCCTFAKSDKKIHEDFKKTQQTLYGEPSLTDDRFIHYVNTYPALIELLYLNNSLVTDKALQCFTNLRKLNLSVITSLRPQHKLPFISDQGIMGLTNLTLLNLDGYYANVGIMMTDNALKNLTKIQTLSLFGNQTITDNGITHLCSLTSLNLSRQHYLHTKITDKGLSKLTNLEHLYMYGNIKINDEGIAPLTKLKTLEGGSEITDNVISKLTNLNRLCIDYENLITDTGICDLTNLKDLVCGRRISNSGFKNLTNLTELDITDNSQITYDGITHLKELRILKINQHEQRFTQEQIEVLRGKNVKVVEEKMK